MIIFMQAGTALFNAGSTREKNLNSVLLIKMFETCLGCIGFWLIGYGIAFGLPENLVGTDPRYYSAVGFDSIMVDQYGLFMFQLSFSIASTTMISGAMAERGKLP